MSRHHRGPRSASGAKIEAPNLESVGGGARTEGNVGDQRVASNAAVQGEKAEGPSPGAAPKAKSIKTGKKRVALRVSSNMPELSGVLAWERDLLGPTVAGLVDRLVKEEARKDDGAEGEQDE